MRAVLIVPFCVMVLAGCATVTLDAEGCHNANWYDLGHRDGVTGHDSELATYSAQCAPYGSKPDDANYAKGLAEGRSAHATIMAPRRVSLF
jgi:hypothetical protein